MLAVQPRLDVEKEENMSEWIEKMNELSTIPDRETRLQQQSCLVEKSDEQFRKGFAIEIKNYYIAFASARMLYITGELNYGKLWYSILSYSFMYNIPIVAPVAMMFATKNWKISSKLWLNF
jgi:hypothetical protein